MDQRKHNLSKFLTGFKPESMTEVTSLNSEENLLESDISLMSTPTDPLRSQSEFFTQMRGYLLNQQESLRKNLERLKEKAEYAKLQSSTNKAKIPSHSSTSTLALHDSSSHLTKLNKRFSPEPMNAQHWESLHQEKPKETSVPICPICGAEFRENLSAAENSLEDHVYAHLFSMEMPES